MITAMYHIKVQAGAKRLRIIKGAAAPNKIVAVLGGS